MEFGEPKPKTTEELEKEYIEALELLYGLEDLLQNEAGYSMSSFAGDIETLRAMHGITLPDTIKKVKELLEEMKKQALKKGLPPYYLEPKYLKLQYQKRKNLTNTELYPFKRQIDLGSEH